MYAIIKMPFFATGSVALCLLAACSGSSHTGRARAGGHFTTQPIMVDGNDSDWPSPYPNYDDKAKISYAVANDKDNLYLTVKAGDRRMQHKIMMGGMKVWLDASGQKQETVSIDYPVKQAGRAPASDEEPKTRKEDNDRPVMRDTSRHNRLPVNATNDYTLSGFTGCNGNFTLRQPAPCGIKVSMGRNDYNELVWEASVPLSVLYNGASPASFSGRPVSVCFEIGSIPTPARPAGGHTGGRGSMGGGMHGGGMGGGMHGGHRGGGGMDNGSNNDDHTEIPTENTKTWVKTAIALQ